MSARPTAREVIGRGLDDSAIFGTEGAAASIDRHLTPDELAALPPGQLYKAAEAASLSEVYDYEAHVRIGENLDGKGRLPSTFMLLAPASWHPDVWHDINRMACLNAEQSKRGLEAHVCLARGSQVLTRAGYKPIQEVAVGEHVLTHLGRWRPVLAVQNTGVRPVVTVKAQGVPGLTLTPDHKLWTRLAPRAMTARRDARAATPGWVPAGDTLGSYLNLKLPPVDDHAEGDAPYWWIVGRWLADGHIDKRNVAHISCGDDKLEHLLERLGQHAGNPRHTGTAHQVPLRDANGELRRRFKACGHGAGGKHLPPEAFTLPTDLARALLDGYLSGDGHLVPERMRWMATSVSRELLLGMVVIVQRVYGAVASLHVGRPAGTTVIQGRTVNTRQEWILSFDMPRSNQRVKPFVLDDGAWKKVRSVEPAGEVETWNLRVAEDESYTAEGCVVKNCPLQFDIVDRLIERYSNPGELVFDPFSGLGTVPVRALRLGRRGRGVELNPGYWADSVKYLQAEERRVAMPTLFDLDVDGSAA
jgi:hypothetical protein